MLTHKDINGLMAIVETPAKGTAIGAKDFDTVNVDEAARVTDQFIKDGAGAILALGTGGECATLLWEEQKALAEGIIGAAKKRVPVIIGTTTLSTRDTVRRLQTIMDMGANGTMLGIPMWQAPTFEEAVAHYKMVSEAAPTANIFVYANPQAFRFDFPPEFWGVMHKEVPAVIAAKYSDRENYAAALKASENSIRMCPVYASFLAFARVNAEHTTACWAHSVQPQPTLAMIEAVKRKDWAKAEEIQKDFQWASHTQEPPVSREEHGQLNVQLVKIRDDAAGYMKAGPMRPPYHLMSQSRIEGAREAGRRWKTLAEKYSRVAAK